MTIILNRKSILVYTYFVLVNLKFKELYSKNQNNFLISFNENIACRNIFLVIMITLVNFINLALLA